ncbi:hypothetical protein C5Y93_11040 [Blastopirellula marina]|uniref:Uncharacterized protein n=1 Tax=Blastopirellula marina TaxID=124 RepID=A0A2S8GNS7_9BACT|nr:hypothetical protein C5Y93_11040 [Blastopirellula marina]
MRLNVAEAVAVRGKIISRGRENEQPGKRLRIANISANSVQVTAKIESNELDRATMRGAHELLPGKSHTLFDGGIIAPI